MGYLSSTIIFFLFLAAVLGFVVAWLLRGSKFQSELQDLDGRWRAKLSETEGERDRFVTELTQANETKTKLEADIGRLGEAHDSDLASLKREHENKIAAFADTEKLTSDLKSDLAAKKEELSRFEAEVAKLQQSGNHADQLAQELVEATKRAADLEASLTDSQAALASCKREAEQLNAENAKLRLAVEGTADGSTGASGPANASPSTSTATIVPMSFMSSDTRAASEEKDGQIPEETSSGSGAAETESEAAPSPAALTDTGGDDDDDANNISGSSAQKRTADDDGEGGTRPVALSEARGGKADDLKKISGVGPKLEKTLNSLGIYHFTQIAEFTPENVAWVDRHLRFKGRIAREKWIDQAKALAEES